jgi:hypothetical protein
MHEAFDAGLKLDEGSELGNARDHAADALTSGELFRDGIPGVGL